MAETTKEAKAKTFFFKNTVYPGLEMQVQGKKKNKDGEEVEFVAESARFTQYYDIFKGDVVRVGYLATESEAVAKRCADDVTCEEITEKEYKEATEGDKALKRAPVPAV